MRILHVIHDFLPVHRAGSELYVRALALAQQRRGHLPHVLCAEYDPGRRHGAIRWRAYDGIPVIEIVNNWRFAGFRETYRSPFIANRTAHALAAVKPDVVHIHNLLNLTFELPELARRAGAAVVATLHDFTLVCPSGGQRVHVAEQHVCLDIVPERCARCFMESPWQAQMRWAALPQGAVSKAAYGIGRRLRAYLPARFPPPLAANHEVTPADIRERLDSVRRLFPEIDLFVAPSRSLADDYVKWGLPARRIRVSDYGFERLERPARRRGPRLRIGFVGTIVWHKGVHVLLEAIRSLPADRVELKIYGDPDCFPAYGSTLRRCARDLANVSFEGPFVESERAAVLAGIDVLVVPSLWPENSPLIIHEAFLAGVPVVAARTGGIPELVAHEGNGLLYDPFSSAELAECLGRLTREAGLLDRLASKLPPVKDIDADAEEWDRIYLDLVG